MPGQAGRLLAFLLLLAGAVTAPAEEIASPLAPDDAGPAASIAWPATGRAGGKLALAPGRGTTPAFLEAIAAWLAVEFGLPAMDEAPAVKFVSAREMIEARLRDMPSTSSGADLMAVYDDATGTIFLPQEWMGASAAERSVLVHEMVHHLQNSAGRRFECAEARETMAYEAQARWLAASGSSLAAEFGIDPLTLLIRTSCFR